MNLDLNLPIEQLYLVGPIRAKLLKKLEINTLSDLLFYFPRLHQDLSKITPIKDLRLDELATVKVKILEIKNFRTKIRKLNITQALVEDDTGNIVCVWYNQPFLSKIIKPHEQFLFSGKVAREKGKLILQNPIYEQEKTEQIHTARLVPVYPLTAQLTQKQLRTIIKTYLDKVNIPEYLPLKIIKQEQLLSQDLAVKTFHFPRHYTDLHKAQKRLAFDEVFQTQIKVLQYKLQRLKENAYPIKNLYNLEEKIKALPFTLTPSQAKALDEITQDLNQSFPANRLLEGDVGSGKTIVVALVMWLNAKNNFQTALLAPTEVLATQHYTSLLEFFTKDGINIGLLTSTNQRLNGNKISKQTLISKLASGEIQIILGTHALLEKNIQFKNLSLVVIDEQHRFGVIQRAELKKLHYTHLVSMSATPIPRTLALTLYGDLDISVLSEKPAGRIKIMSQLISEQDRKQTYQFIRNEILAQRQAYVICPLIESSDKLGVKSVTAEYEKLKAQIFPDLKIGLLHGKLKSSEKEDVMREFNNNGLNILVTTSVVEVGVDVPNATVMMIEGAERFGLAQLHQFRGRVGRSTHQSYCFLFSNHPEATSNERLLAFLQTDNGFELAEKDLQIRGSGDLYGTAQSGYGFKIATLSNLDMVERSKRYAEQVLGEDPLLNRHPLLREKIQQLPMIHLE